MRLRRATGLGLGPVGRLLAGGPLAFGEHGAGLFAGGGVDQVVAEEYLRGCCAGSAVLGDVVGADVDGRGGRGGDHLDGHGLAVSAGDAVGLAFGGLNDELEDGHVGRDAGHGEGEGLTLAGDGGGAGVLDTDECRGIADGGAAAGDNPVCLRNFAQFRAPGGASFSDAMVFEDVTEDFVGGEEGVAGDGTEG